MTPTNILKVADLEQTDLSPIFVEWLKKEYEPIYIDKNSLKEHLYDVEDILENITEGKEHGFQYPEVCLSQLSEIWECCHTNKCAYFRMVTN